MNNENTEHATPPITDAELAELEAKMPVIGTEEPQITKWKNALELAMATPRLIAEVRRLNTENADLKAHIAKDILKTLDAGMGWTIPTHDQATGGSGGGER